MKLVPDAAEEELLVGAQREGRERVGGVLGDDARGACARLRIIRRGAAPREQRPGRQQAGAHQQRRAQGMREMPTGAREVGREADCEQRGGGNDQPARGGIAAGAEGRRAHDERREQAQRREAGPRDGVIVQRERGEHEPGRGQQRPAAAASQRCRQCHEAGARRSCRRRRSRRRSPGRSRRARPRVRSRRAPRSRGGRSHAWAPAGAWAHDPRCACSWRDLHKRLSTRSALDRTLLRAGPYPPIG